MNGFIIVCILLLAINVGAIENAVGCTILGIYTIFAYQIMNSKKIYLNALNKSPTWLLLFSGFFYGMASYITGKGAVYSMARYFVIPILVFLAGYTITNRKNNYTLSAERCLCAIAIGCAVHAILNITVNIGLTNRMETVDYFLGLRSATNLGSMNTFIFGLLPCLVITKRKKIKIAGSIFFSASIIYGFMLGTRSSIYGLVVMTIISAITIIYKHYSKGLKLNVLAKWCGVGIILIGVIVAIYYTDFMKIRTNIEASLLLNRLRSGGTATSDLRRFNLFKEGMAYLFYHPFGGNKIDEVYYFHNYWLDVGRVAGVIPVILIISLDIMLFRHMLIIFRNDSIDEDFRYALFGIYICIFINFFFEPIMDGYLDLFYRFTFINGMTEGLYYSLCRTKNAEVMVETKKNI